MKKKITLSVKGQIFFIKRLVFMMKAGLPLSESLHIMNSNVTSQRLARLLFSLEDGINHGVALHTTLAQHISGINTSTIQLVKAGEENGNLSENLEYLAENLKKAGRLRQKIISALIYPLCIAVGTIALSGFLTLFIFPKIKPLFLNMHIQLPISTRILMGMSTFLEHYWFITLSLFFGIISILIILVRKNIFIRYVKDKLLVTAPLVRKMYREYCLIGISRDIGTKLKSGLPIEEAIDPETTSNLVYKKSLLKLKLSVGTGEKVSETLKLQQHLYPSLFIEMLATAELTGTMGDTLLYLSDYFEHEVEDVTKNISSILEPILMICMGLIVGFISLSIILPIYEISQNVR
jgi:type IV pilus assembly protein PilC